MVVELTLSWGFDNNPLWLFRAQLGFRIQVRAECGNNCDTLFLLRNLALQCLVLNNWPTELFLPGEGYSHQTNSFRLLTKECEGVYEMTWMEESMVYGDGSEGSDGMKELLREHYLKTGVVQVARPSNKEWVIGLISFSLGEWLFRHECVKLDGRMTGVQDWIDGSSLVRHTVHERHFTHDEDNTDSDDTSSGDGTSAREEKCGFNARVAVTFYQDMFNSSTA